MIAFKYFRTVTLENFYCITQEILKYFKCREPTGHYSSGQTCTVVIQQQSGFCWGFWIKSKRMEFSFITFEKNFYFILNMLISTKEKKVNQWIYKGE